VLAWGKQRHRRASSGEARRVSTVNYQDLVSSVELAGTATHTDPQHEPPSLNKPARAIPGIKKVRALRERNCERTKKLMDVCYISGECVLFGSRKSPNMPLFYRSFHKNQWPKPTLNCKRYNRGFVPASSLCMTRVLPCWDHTVHTRAIRSITVPLLPCRGFCDLGDDNFGKQRVDSFHFEIQSLCARCVHWH